jgi:hypothetical protein
MRRGRARRCRLALLAAGALGVSAACPVAAGADESARVLLTDEGPYLPGTQGAFIPHRDQYHRPQHGSSHRPYHPAPGIIVDVLDAAGAVIPNLQRTARNLGYWPFRHCYEDGLRRNQALGGAVWLDLHLVPDTSARRTEVTSSSMKDDVVTACVAREAHRLVLDPVDAAMTARVRVLLALGDEPVAGPIPIPGGSDVRTTLRASWPDATACFEASLARHPEAGGRVELRFEIDDDGAVARVAPSGVPYADAETTTCVADVYRKVALAIAHAVPGKAFVYAVHFEPASAVLPPPPLAGHEEPLTQEVGR